MSPHTSTGQLVDTYTGTAANPEEYCTGQLEFIAESGIDDLTDFSLCHSYHVFLLRDSKLDSFARVCTFFFIACFCALELQQQSISGKVRRILYKEKEKTYFWSWLNIGFKIVEIIQDKVLLSVVPAGMVIMLTMGGISADKCLIDGLSIVFILEVDDLLLSTISSYSEIDKLKRYVQRLIAHNTNELPVLHEVIKNRAVLRGLGVTVYQVVTIEVAKIGTCENIYFAVIEGCVIMLVTLGLLDESIFPFDRLVDPRLRVLYALVDCAIGILILFLMNLFVHHIFYEL